MKTFTYIVKEKDDWQSATEFILREFPQASIFLLKGNLGSGKTALVQAMGRALGVKEPITSPSFSILHEYHYPKGKIYHFDLYRIKNTDELKNIGLEEILYSGAYCYIEWPNIAQRILKDQTSLHEKMLIITIESDQKSMTREVHLYFASETTFLL